LTFEREILRKIFGPMQAMWVWKIRYNNEVYKFYDDMALSTFLCLKRVNWVCQIARTDDSHIPAKK
jgi:hypothetical protein